MKNIKWMHLHTASITNRILILYKLVLLESTCIRILLLMTILHEDEFNNRITAASTSPRRRQTLETFIMITRSSSSQPTTQRSLHQSSWGHTKAWSLQRTFKTSERYWIVKILSIQTTAVLTRQSSRLRIITIITIVIGMRALARPPTDTADQMGCTKTQSTS